MCEVSGRQAQDCFSDEEKQSCENRRERHSREASFALFRVHYPVSFLVAFYVVQWDTSIMLGEGIGLLIKMLVVVIGSFAGPLGLYELLVRRINPARAVFGLKPRTT